MISKPKAPGVAGSITQPLERTGDQAVFESIAQQHVVDVPGIRLPDMTIAEWLTLRSVEYQV